MSHSIARYRPDTPPTRSRCGSRCAPSAPTAILLWLVLPQLAFFAFLIATDQRPYEGEVAVCDMRGPNAEDRPGSEVLIAADETEAEEGVPFVVITTNAMHEAAEAYAAQRTAALAEGVAASGYHVALRPIVRTVEECVAEHPGVAPGEAVRRVIFATLGEDTAPEAAAEGWNSGTIPTTEDGHPRAYVLLIGDVPGVRDRDNATDREEPNPAEHVPTFYRDTQVVPEGIDGLQGQRQVVASDNPYAARDEDDGVPILPVGRLPFTTPEELATYAQQIEAYETQPTPGAWRTHISLFAGDPGFDQLGAQVRRMIEMVWTRTVVGSLDPSVTARMSYANVDSPYSWPPPTFTDRVTSELEEGALIWNYIGHGWIDAVDRLRWNGRRYPVFTVQEAREIDCSARPPMAAFFTCYTGYFDAPGDSLAEALLRNPNGPIGVFASSRVSGEVNLMYESAFFELSTTQRVPTMGELALRTERVALTKRLPIPDALANQIGIDTHAGYTESKRGHVAMYNLLGDPTVRLAYAAGTSPNVAEAPETAAPGDSIRLVMSGAPEDIATLDVEIHINRPAILGELEALPGSWDTPEEREAYFAAMERNHAIANDRLVVRATIDAHPEPTNIMDPGLPRAELTIPEGVPAGAYTIIVRGMDADGHVRSLSSSPLTITE